MYKGKKILNIDQTPLGDSNFVQKGWMPSDSRLSKKIKLISPRITMIAAIDSDGDCYWSLLQANSNAKTLEMFLYYLVRILDNKDP